MRNQESPDSVLQKNPAETLDEAIEEVVNHFPVKDLASVKEYAELPENPSPETVSNFISRHGMGFFNTIIQEIEKVREKVGISYDDFRKALLQTLDHLKV